MSIATLREALYRELEERAPDLADRERIQRRLIQQHLPPGSELLLWARWSSFEFLNRDPRVPVRCRVLASAAYPLAERTRSLGGIGDGGWTTHEGIILQPQEGLDRAACDGVALDLEDFCLSVMAGRPHAVEDVE